MDEALPDRPRKGRGAVGNPTGRYEPHRRHAVDDGWPLEEDLPPLRTVIGEDASRTIFATNNSPDIGFDQSVNPYRGCEHGCIYCYARPTHAWLGLSPGLDFESRLFRKSRAPELLREALARPGYVCRPFMLGANTDPYQPIERRFAITRRILEVCVETAHPLTIVSKSALIVRDLDLLADLAARRLVSVGISVTTLDPDLARTMEPRAATPVRRLETIRRLGAAGVPVAVMAAPMIPALNDAELERILEAAAEAGARAAAYVLVRLPLEIKDLFADWLRAHAPAKASHVLNLIRETRGGQLYQSAFGTRMRGTGPYAELLARRFRLARARLGLDRRDDDAFDLDTGSFRPPPRPGEQLRLL